MAAESTALTSGKIIIKTQNNGWCLYEAIAIKKGILEPNAQVNADYYTKVQSVRDGILEKLPNGNYTFQVKNTSTGIKNTDVTSKEQYIAELQKVHGLPDKPLPNIYPDPTLINEGVVENGYLARAIADYTESTLYIIQGGRVISKVTPTDDSTDTTVLEYSVSTGSEAGLGGHYDIYMPADAVSGEPDAGAAVSGAAVSGAAGAAVAPPSKKGTGRNRGPAYATKQAKAAAAAAAKAAAAAAAAAGAAAAGASAAGAADSAPPSKKYVIAPSAADAFDRARVARSKITELIILGERVRMMDENTVPDSILFSKEYIPELVDALNNAITATKAAKDTAVSAAQAALVAARLVVGADIEKAEKDLDDANKQSSGEENKALLNIKFATDVFIKYFKNKDLDLSNPMPPCDREGDESKRILVNGLTTRFKTLRGQLRELGKQGTDSLEYSVLLTKATLFNDFIRRLSHNQCATYKEETPFKLTTSEAELTDDKMKSILRTFVFLVLQGINPVEKPGWTKKFSSFSDVFINLIKNQTLVTEEELREFQTDYSTGGAAVPDIVTRVLAGTSADASANNDALLRSYDAMKVELDANGSNELKAAIIAHTAAVTDKTPVQKIEDLFRVAREQLGGTAGALVLSERRAAENNAELAAARAAAEAANLQVRRAEEAATAAGAREVAAQAAVAAAATAGAAEKAEAARNLAAARAATTVATDLATAATREKEAAAAKSERLESEKAAAVKAADEASAKLNAQDADLARIRAQRKALKGEITNKDATIASHAATIAEAEAARGAAAAAVVVAEKALQEAKAQHAGVAAEAAASKAAAEAQVTAAAAALQVEQQKSAAKNGERTAAEAQHAAALEAASAQHAAALATANAAKEESEGKVAAASAAAAAAVAASAAAAERVRVAEEARTKAEAGTAKLAQKIVELQNALDNASKSAKDCESRETQSQERLRVATGEVHAAQTAKAQAQAAGSSSQQQAQQAQEQLAAAQGRERNARLEVAAAVAAKEDANKELIRVKKSLEEHVAREASTQTQLKSSLQRQLELEGEVKRSKLSGPAYLAERQRLQDALKVVEGQRDNAYAEMERIKRAAPRSPQATPPGSRRGSVSSDAGSNGSVAGRSYQNSTVSSRAHGAGSGGGGLNPFMQIYAEIQRLV